MSAVTPLLIQVVPRLAPGRDGVGDHALVLAHELQAAFGIGTAFAVANSSELYNLPYPAIFCSPSSLLERCLELTQGRSAAMLVHMSGYGYSRDGAPKLLADALDMVKASGRFRLAIYFHELFATGMPWRSVFWHSHRQRKALNRLAAQCELMVTNIERHAEWLERKTQKTGGVRVERMPVFSTVGEADEPASFEQRDAALVVFGSAGSRELSYRQMEAAGNLVNALRIEEILDVGPECRQPAQVHGIPVKRVGMLPVEEVPAVFSRARFGLLPHPWYNLAKSSVFAAYCAYGVVPVVAKPFPHEADGLAEGVQVVTPQTAACAGRPAWEDRSRAAWSWYRTHRLHVHAERYAQWMGELR
jgi:hypothetical protein